MNFSDKIKQATQASEDKLSRYERLKELAKAQKRELSRTDIIDAIAYAAAEAVEVFGPEVVLYGELFACEVADYLFGPLEEEGGE